MEYVSKEAVLDAIKDHIHIQSDSPAEMQEIVANIMNAVKISVAELEPAIDTDVDIAEILYREPRELIKVHRNLTICPTCRKQLKDGHSYCKRCGQAILR